MALQLNGASSFAQSILDFFQQQNSPHNPKGKSTTITPTNIFLLQILLVAMLECTTFFWLFVKLPSINCKMGKTMPSGHGPLSTSLLA